MATFKQTLPASLRASVFTARETRSGMALDRRPYLVTAAQRKAAPAIVKPAALLPHEPEDARMTGVTRSLYRRLLALNLPATEMRFEASPQLPQERINRRPVLTGARIA